MTAIPKERFAVAARDKLLARILGYCQNLRTV